MLTVNPSPASPGKGTERKKKLVISEHAILRYIERVMGIDLEELKAKILPEDVLKKIKALEGVDGTYPCSEGFKVRIRDRTIVTILTKGGGNGAR